MFINETGMTTPQLVMIAFIAWISATALVDYCIRLIKGVFAYKK